MCVCAHVHTCFHVHVCTEALVNICVKKTVVLDLLVCTFCTAVLRAESIDLEIEQADEYVFPEAGEEEGLNLTNNNAAGITIPRALLLERATASGEEQFRIPYTYLSIPGMRTPP